MMTSKEVERFLAAHWELWKCGNNVPYIVVGDVLRVGGISGAVYGQNQILCGNVFSTQWLVLRRPLGP